MNLAHMEAIVFTFSRYFGSRKNPQESTRFTPESGKSELSRYSARDGIFVLPIMMNAAVPEGTPPRWIRTYKKPSRPAVPRRGTDAGRPH
jgi:hypothetical protein